MKDLLVLLSELFLVTVTIIGLYRRFVLPATLSKEKWYTDYLQLVDFIKKVDNMEQLDEAVEAYYKFAADKANNCKTAHHDCVERLVKMLSKKYRIYKNRAVIA